MSRNDPKKEIKNCKVEVNYVNGTKDIYNVKNFIFLALFDKSKNIKIDRIDDPYYFYCLIDLLEKEMIDLKNFANENIPGFDSAVEIFKLAMKNDYKAYVRKYVKGEFEGMTEELFLDFKKYFGGLDENTI